MINHGYLIARRGQQPDAAITTTNTDPRMLRELSSTMNDTKRIMERRNIADSIDFILWNDLWNQYGIFGTKRNAYRALLNSNKINRGRVVMVDYGYHNIGKELSYYHAGIVVQNYTGFVVVVPVTSDQGQTFAQDIEDAIIRVKAADHPEFDNDSILLVHQLRAIDKNRIRKDLFKSISGTDLMLQLEKHITQQQAPAVFRRNAELEAELQSKTDQLQVFREQIQMLEAKLGDIVKEAAPADESLVDKKGNVK